MSPSSLSLRLTNVPETIIPVSKSLERESFIASPPSSTIDVLRDVRAYEHQRQRVKKTAELVKAKERKEKIAAAGRNTWSPWGDKSKPSAVNSSKSSWFGGREVKGVWDEKEQLETDTPVTTPIRVTSGVNRLPTEVALADLVTSKKQRKTKGERVLLSAVLEAVAHARLLSEGDFEVIPPPRSVIVLDEFSVHDMDVDEPWEHVSGDMDEKAEGLSYAQIVSTAK